MAMAAWLIQLVLVLAAAVTPLSETERIVIETARDDRTHEEEAFAVLLTHVAQWAPAAGSEVGDEPIRLAPDYAAMIEAPQAYRGELCRIEGRIEQRTGLGGPFAGSDEWFIRTADGTPVIVYLPVDDAMKQRRDGERVAIDARFYKRMTLEARDGTERQYAAFVGARPWVVATQTGNPLNGLWVLGGLVALLLVVFTVLFAVVRRGGARRAWRGLGGSLGGSADDVDGADAALPADPAEALAELKRRTEAAR
jgi:hypothetical protein